MVFVNRELLHVTGETSLAWVVSGGFGESLRCFFPPPPMGFYCHCNQLIVSIDLFGFD